MEHLKILKKLIDSYQEETLFVRMPHVFLDIFVYINHLIYIKKAFTGVPGKTNHGQLSVFVTKEMKVLTPCLRDIPLSGLKDHVCINY